MKHKKSHRTVISGGLLIAALCTSIPQAQADPLSAAEFFTYAGPIGMVVSAVTGCGGITVLRKYNPTRIERPSLTPEERAIAQLSPASRWARCGQCTTVASAILFALSCGSLIWAETIATEWAG